jgi:septum formation protein
MSSKKITLLLASASPRRSALLKEAGISFTVCPPEVDEEKILGDGLISRAVLRARAKAEEVAKKFPEAIVLAADTIVESEEGELLGKPATPEEASEMFRSLLGTRHQVMTAACVIQNGQGHDLVDEALVKLKNASEEEISAYLKTGESLGKAGGLCIQGEGRRFVENILGEEAVVLGLPMKKILRFLELG